jgi:hypothetical protein
MSNMTSQRPFFSNFLAAFRAHSAIQQQSKAPSSSAASPASQPTHSSAVTSSTTTNNTPSHPRSIATKSQGATTSALTQLHSPRTHSTSPLSHSPGQGGPSTSAGYSTSDRMRRGSDSSSEGFRDVMGQEKWYIGGRTAAGEERFFKLGVVKRHRSIDRLSLDRLSL